MDALATGLFLALLVVFVGVLLLAVRHRLAFRIGVRNVRRSPRRTALLVVGLLIGTSIIAGSLVVGDSLNTLVVHYTVLAVGHDDESVTNTSGTGALGYFPYSVYTSLRTGTLANPEIAGVTPEIVTRVSILDQASGVPQPGLFLIGVNGNQSASLGEFASTSGAQIPGPAGGGVLLDQLAASQLNASAGDPVLLYGPGAQAFPMRVQAVVEDDQRGSFPQGGVGNYGSAFVNLSEAQQLELEPGAINYLAVTNSGDLSERLARAPSVSSALNSTLSGIPSARGLSVDETLKNSLATEEATASGVTTLFLLLGLFSIAAGALLIVAIFLLLAEERKREMGILRAIGLRGGELVYAFLFEGVIYSAGSALAGTALGVGVGYGLTYAFGLILATPSLTAKALLDSFTVAPDSLLLAYVAGFLLSLATVAGASRRASRLNIVRAVRDLPEPPPTRRTYTWGAVLGAVSILLGALLYAATRQGTTPLSDPILGGTLVLVGAGLVAARFVRNRLTFTALGLALLVWAGLEPLHVALLGTSHGAGVYGLFLEGVVLVAGAILVCAFNSASIVAALVRIAGGRTGRAPVAEVALSHPGRRPGPTTLTLAIFALVTFTLVVIAGVGSSLDASLSSDVADESGGYALLAYSQGSAPGLPGFVASNATLSPYFSEVVPLETGGISVSGTGRSAPPYNDSLYAGPAGEPASSDFYSTNQYTYSATLGGMSASQINAALASEPGVAVVDQSYSTVSNSLVASAPASHPTVDPGGRLTLTNPANGNTTTVTVLGVMTQTVLGGVFVGPATAAQLGITAQTLFLLHLSEGASASAAARAATRTLFPYGLVVVDIEGAVASSIASTEGEVALLEIFVALGLVVGIAAMGIVALRAVAERRREIGMLRANGFTEGMVVRAFLLESSYITLLGLAIGTALGLLIVWNLTHSPEGTASSVTTFAMPWAEIAAIVGVAYGLSMASVAQPSLRAARLRPAEAVRSSE
ncbi:MAG TPA: FtsX-like permease family protein [Thermoplasmata archaeon]|nr:FtsX-like permease family protein [Thermoplasmata archaeon]